MGDKFKVGDEIIKVSDDYCSEGAIGRLAVVTQVDGDGLPWARVEGVDYAYYNEEATELSCLDQKDWEIAHIVDSPLWKALG